MVKYTCGPRQHTDDLGENSIYTIFVQMAVDPNRNLIRKSRLKEHQSLLRGAVASPARLEKGGRDRALSAQIPTCCA